MKISRLLWAGSLALFLFVLLLMSVPARLLNYVVPADQLMMSGLSGTLWDGHAAAVRLRLPQGYWHLGSVSWTLGFFTLCIRFFHGTMASHFMTSHFDFFSCRYHREQGTAAWDDIG